MPDHNNQELEKRFVLSLIFTSLILVAEVIGGLWTGSLALLSDAAHVFMDIFALGLSFFAVRLSALPPDDRHSYGYHRLEVIAALINGVSLGAIAFGIFSEAYRRWQNPLVVKEIPMLGIAVAGLVVNLVVAWVLGKGESHVEGENPIHKDLNLHSAFLHVLGDAISSVGVILAAVIIGLTGWEWMDPAMSVLIGLIILVSSFRVLRSAVHILVEGVPEGLSLATIKSAINGVPGVTGTHDLHVWNICSGHVALSAHVVLPEASVSRQQTVMHELQNCLDRQFRITHTTIQIEEVPCQRMETACDS